MSNKNQKQARLTRKERHIMDEIDYIAKLKNDPTVTKEEYEREENRVFGNIALSGLIKPTPKKMVDLIKIGVLESLKEDGVITEVQFDSERKKIMYPSAIERKTIQDSYLETKISNLEKRLEVLFPELRFGYMENATLGVFMLDYKELYKGLIGFTYEHLDKEISLLKDDVVWDKPLTAHVKETPASPAVESFLKKIREIIAEEFKEEASPE